MAVAAGTTHSHFTLSGLKSMPCLLLNDDENTPSHSASALMAIDLDSPPPAPKRPLTRIYDESPLEEEDEEQIYWFGYLLTVAQVRRADIYRVTAVLTRRIPQMLPRALNPCKHHQRNLRENQW